MVESLGLLQGGAVRKWELLVCHWQNLCVLWETRLEALGGEGASPQELLLASGACPQPLSIPCSAAAANWSDRAARVGMQQEEPRAGFVKPHPVSSPWAAHCHANEPAASCIKFCQKLLTFFVSTL